MDHQLALERLCRVCGGNINRYRVRYACIDHATLLHTVFSISVDEEDVTVHPTHFCDACYVAMSKKAEAIKEDRVMLLSLKKVDWNNHKEDLCETYSRHAIIKKGGRPKKARKNRGAPNSKTCHSLIEHTKAIASEPLYDNRDGIQISSADQLIEVDSGDYMCNICNNVLNSPIKLSCEHLICSQCLIKWLETSQGTLCPSCDNPNHHLELSNISPIDRIHHSVLEQLITKCTACNANVKLGDLSKHLNSNCRKHSCTTSARNSQLVKTMVVDNQIEIKTGAHVSSNSHKHDLDIIIILIESGVTEFIKNYKTQFPKATVTPKMHMMTKHLPQQIQEWKYGMGFLGEQGAESVHALFNNIERSYLGMPNKVERLKSVIKEHHMRLEPCNLAFEPPTGKTSWMR